MGTSDASSNISLEDSIDILRLPDRLSDLLKRNNVNTIGELKDLYERGELINIRLVGDKKNAEVGSKLTEFGLIKTDTSQHEACHTLSFKIGTGSIAIWTNEHGITVRNGKLEILSKNPIQINASGKHVECSGTSINVVADRIAEFHYTY